MNFSGLKVYDYNTNFKLLSKFAETESSSSKKLFVFAGPNASGKSTLIAHLYRTKVLSDQYLNADVFAKTIFADIESDFEKNHKSMFYTIDKVENSLKNGGSFVYETVLSHVSKLELVKKAKSLGYTVCGIFVCPEIVEINIERLKNRVVQGGHDVPRDKLIARYYRSIENGKLLEKLCDEFYYFDNSLNRELFTENDLDK